MQNKKMFPANFDEEREGAVPRSGCRRVLQDGSGLPPCNLRACEAQQPVSSSLGFSVPCEVWFRGSGFRGSGFRGF